MAQPTKVKVRIVHGNLSHTTYPVATGHYADAPLSGSEKYLDWCLGGLLKERFQLGLYPADLGTSDIILLPSSSPTGSILIGLGNMGNLTPLSLESTLSRAFLTYTVQVAEHKEPLFGVIDDGRRAAPLASLLMGVSYSSMLVEEVVQTILYAVCSANTNLRGSIYGEKVLINRLDLVELWQDRAIHIAHAVSSAKNDSILADQFDFEDCLVEQGIGRLVRVTSYEQQEKTWRRLRISCDSQVKEMLRYEVLSLGARTEVSAVSMQTSLVDAYVSEVVANTAREPQVGSILFELLVPLELKQTLRDRRNLVLMLDEDAAQYPWELLNDRPTDNARPFAVTAGLLRKLQTDTYRVGVTSRITSALIVGNPKQTLMPDLPAAQEEAIAVRGLLLEYNYKVALLTDTRATSSEIIKALYESPYRILHLAGHGVYNMPLQKLLGTDSTKNKAPTEEDAYITGMIIGDGVFLTVAEIAQMRYVPELVFINCCYLGRIEHQDKLSSNNYPKLAANLAAQFISIGVRVVIAAGWAVDDKAGQAFALTLYKGLLKGKPLGQAVLDSRLKTYETFKGVDTWGAFQIYGDSDFYLAERSDPTDVPDNVADDSIQFYDRAEAVVALENLVGDFLLSTTIKSVERLRQKLRNIEVALPQQWKSYADLLAALGWAYSESGQLDKAVKYYELAIKSSQSTMSLSSIERLGELKGLLAIQFKMSSQSDSENEQIPSLITDGIEILQRLCLLTSSAHSYSLLGDTYCRQVRLVSNDEVIGVVENMDRAYRKAAELGGDSTYIKTNNILAKAIKYWLKSEGKAETIIREAQKFAIEPISFYTEMLLIKMLILSLLLKEELELKVPEILQRYQHAFTRSSSPLARIRNEEFIGFMVDIANCSTFSQSLLDQKTAVERINDALIAMASI